jgi:hypothetical protein
MTYILIGGLILALGLIIVGGIIQANYDRMITRRLNFQRFNHRKYSSGYNRRKGYTTKR